MPDLQSVPVSVGRGVHFNGHHHQELCALYKSMRSGVFKDDRGNKIDLKRFESSHQHKKNYISALTGEGVSDLKRTIKRSLI